MIVTGPPSTTYVWEPITIGEQLDRTAAAHGESDALIQDDVRLTWRDVREHARAFAKALVAAGVGRGEHIAVWLPNQIEWVIAWFGATYAGAVVIPLNSRYKVEEVRYILGQSNSTLLLMRNEFLGIDFAEMLTRLRSAHTTSEELPDLRTVVSLAAPPPDTLPFDDFIAAGASVSDDVLEARSAAVRWDDPTIIVYTSGTTGHPKGAVHSHKVLRNECSITEWLGIGPESCVMGHMPFFHVAGAFTGLLPPLITGCRLVLMSSWNVEKALSLIQREQVTVFSGIPTHFIDLLNHPRLAEYDTSSLRAGWMGGASNPPDVIDGAINVLGIKRLLPVYGMTETTSVTTFPRPDDPREIILRGVGVPVSDFELKVVDPKTGEEVDQATEGEVCVRGHLVMDGYYRNPEATAAAIDADGWFHTGDLGVLDANGYLAITGRNSDMFIVGGSNAYPAEIELSICELPDVVQAYVVGVPDSRLGEVGYAFIQLRTGSTLDEAEVLAFCKRRLADFKVPRYVEFVDELPTTSTGKIQRFRLQEIGRERVLASR